MNERQDMSASARTEKVIELRLDADQAPEFVVRLDTPATGCTCLVDRITLRGWFLAGAEESTRLLEDKSSIRVLLEEHCERVTPLYANMNFYGRALEENADGDVVLEDLRVFPAAADQFGPLPVELGHPWCVEAVLNFVRLPFGEQEEIRTFVALLRVELGERVSTSNEVCFSLLRLEARDQARGGLEYPASGCVASDVLVVEGWAMKPGDRPVSAEIFAADRSLGQAVCGLPSPAQADALPYLPETEACRFALSLLRKNLPPGLPRSFPLRALVTFQSGGTLELNGPQFHWSASPEAELLGEGETIRVVEEGLIEIEGWVLAPGFETPRLFLEGRSWRVEPPDVVWHARPDIGARFPVSDRNEPAGFSVRIHPEILGRFPGVVRLAAETSRGRLILGSDHFQEELTRRVSGLLPELQGAESLKFSLSASLCRAGARKKFNRPVEPAAKAEFPRRIAFATHNLSRMEGAPRVLFEIIRGLVESGSDPSSLLVVSAYPGEFGAELNRLGVRVEIRPELRAHDQDWDRYHASAAEAAELFREHGTELVFANVIDAFWAPDTARRLGLPAFWLLHESIDPLGWYPQLEPRLRMLFLSTLLSCPRVGFVAERTRELFASVVPADRSVVIPNGIDETAVAAAKADWSRERARESLGVTNEFTVSIIGTTTPRKGQDIFLREIAELRTIAPELPLRCFIVGARSGDFLDELKGLRRDLGLEKFVELVAETPEIAPYYCASDALVIASREESAPLVSLEAFAYGRPLISTSVFGLAEQLEHETNALVFSGTAPGQLAAALMRLREEPGLAERLVRGGDETLRRKFSLEQARRTYRREIERTYRLFT